MIASVPPADESAGTEQLRLIRPDDWHLHLRDNELLAAVLPATARCFARADKKR